MENQEGSWGANIILSLSLSRSLTLLEILVHEIPLSSRASDLTSPSLMVQLPLQLCMRARERVMYGPLSHTEADRVSESLAEWR